VTDKALDFPGAAGHGGFGGHVAAESLVEAHTRNAVGFACWERGDCPAASRISSARSGSAAGKTITLGRAGVLQLKEAREVARKKFAAVSLNLEVEPVEAPPAPTLRTYIAETYGPWIEAHAKTGNYIHSRLTHVFKDLLDLPLDKVTAWNLEQWRTARRREGIKGTTINRDLQDIRALYSRAVKWGTSAGHRLSECRATGSTSRASSASCHRKESRASGRRFPRETSSCGREGRAPSGKCEIPTASQPLFLYNRSTTEQILIVPLFLIQADSGVPRTRAGESGRCGFMQRVAAVTAMEAP